MNLKGLFTVQARRPVFNSNYNTTTLNFVDNDIHFRYVEFSPLEFDLNSHTSNLTSILAFYAYYSWGWIMIPSHCGRKSVFYQCRTYRV